LPSSKEVGKSAQTIKIESSQPTHLLEERKLFLDAGLVADEEKSSVLESLSEGGFILVELLP